MEELAGVIVLSLFFFVVSAVCLIWPEKIVDNATKNKDKKILGQNNPWKDKINPSQYTKIIKFVGLLSFVAFVIACYTIISEVF